MRIEFPRRQLLVLAAGTAMFGVAWRASRAKGNEIDNALEQVLNGRTLREGRIILDLPEVAENGHTVPLRIEVDSAMTDEDFVRAVHIFADDNPLPNVATFRFTPASGRAHVSTRMRLARSQNVLCLAEMGSGEVYISSRAVDVVIGGCGA
ncbi:MAG: thiosulfate oxidation carrier protein SoxY [Pseudomonadota bacterium]